MLLEVARAEVVDWECINSTTVLCGNSLRERLGLPMAYSFVDKGVAPDVQYGCRATTKVGTVFNFFNTLGGVAFAGAVGNSGDYPFNATEAFQGADVARSDCGLYRRGIVLLSYGFYLILDVW